MLVIFYGAEVIWLLLWHLWWKIHHPAVCNTVLTLKSGQQAASSLHTDGNCLTTGCLPFQTVLSAGLLLLRWIRVTHKLNAEYSACLKHRHCTCFSDISKAVYFWSDVLNLWHIMILQAGDWCIPVGALSCFQVRINLDLNFFFPFQAWTSSLQYINI